MSETENRTVRLPNPKNALKVTLEDDACLWRLALVNYDKSLRKLTRIFNEWTGKNVTR